MGLPLRYDSPGLPAGLEMDGKALGQSLDRREVNVSLMIEAWLQPLSLYATPTFPPPHTHTHTVQRLQPPRVYLPVTLSPLLQAPQQLPEQTLGGAVHGALGPLTGNQSLGLAWLCPDSLGTPLHPPNSKSS